MDLLNRKKVAELKAQVAELEKQLRKSEWLREQAESAYMEAVKDNYLGLIGKQVEWSYQYGTTGCVSTCSGKGVVKEIKAVTSRGYFNGQLIAYAAATIEMSSGNLTTELIEQLKVIE